MLWLENWTCTCITMWYNNHGYATGRAPKVLCFHCFAIYFHIFSLVWLVLKFSTVYIIIVGKVSLPLYFSNNIAKGQRWKFEFWCCSILFILQPMCWWWWYNKPDNILVSDVFGVVAVPCSKGENLLQDMSWTIAMFLSRRKSVVRFIYLRTKSMNSKNNLMMPIKNWYVSY